MPGNVDLRELVARLSDRRPDRTEANVQSDLHLLLTAAALNLTEDQVEPITLEAPAGGRRRIDVEVFSTVFEVKPTSVSATPSPTQSSSSPDTCRTGPDRDARPPLRRRPH